MKSFRGPGKARGNHVPRGTPGWLFPLRGGPYDGIEVRMPWSLSREIDEVYAELPTSLTLAEATYDKTPALFKSGARKGQQKTAKGAGIEWPAVEYVYREAA